MFFTVCQIFFETVLADLNLLANFVVQIRKVLFLKGDYITSAMRRADGWHAQAESNGTALLSVA